MVEMSGTKGYDKWALAALGANGLRARAAPPLPVTPNGKGELPAGASFAARLVKLHCSNVRTRAHALHRTLVVACR